MHDIGDSIKIYMCICIEKSFYPIKITLLKNIDINELLNDFELFFIPIYNRHQLFLYQLLLDRKFPQCLQLVHNLLLKILYKFTKISCQNNLSSFKQLTIRIWRWVNHGWHFPYNIIFPSFTAFNTFVLPIWHDSFLACIILICLIDLDIHDLYKWVFCMWSICKCSKYLYSFEIAVTKKMQFANKGILLH